MFDTSVRSELITSLFQSPMVFILVAARQPRKCTQIDRQGRLDTRQSNMQDGDC